MIRNARIFRKIGKHITLSKKNIVSNKNHRLMWKNVKLIEKPLIINGRKQWFHWDKFLIYRNSEDANGFSFGFSFFFLWFLLFLLCKWLVQRKWHKTSIEWCAEAKRKQAKANIYNYLQNVYKYLHKYFVT